MSTIGEKVHWCPNCGAGLVYYENYKETTCSYCGNTIEKERTINLKYATISNEERYTKGISFSLSKEVSETIELYSKISSNKAMFIESENKNIEPTLFLKLENLIKKLKYSVESFYDENILKIAKEINDIDENNIYAQFCSLYLNNQINEAISLLNRSDSLLAHSVIVERIIAINYKWNQEQIKTILFYLYNIEVSETQKYKNIREYLEKIYDNQIEDKVIISFFIENLRKLEIEEKKKKELIDLFSDKIIISNLEEVVILVTRLIKNKFIESLPKVLEKPIYKYPIDDNMGIYIVEKMSEEKVGAIGIFNVVVRLFSSMSKMTNFYEYLGTKKLTIDYKKMTQIMIDTILVNNITESDIIYAMLKSTKITKPDALKYIKSLITLSSYQDTQEIKKAYLYLEGISVYKIKVDLMMNLSDNSKVSNFQSAWEINSLIKDLKLNSQDKDELIHNNLSRMDNNFTSITGYITLFSLIFDSRDRFIKMTNLFIAKRRSLFFNLIDIQMLHVQGYMKEYELRLACQMMLKTLPFSVSSSGIKEAEKEINEVLSTVTESYPGEIKKEHKKIINWLSKDRVFEKDIYEDKIFSKLVKDADVIYDNNSKESESIIQKENHVSKYVKKGIGLTFLMILMNILIWQILDRRFYFKRISVVEISIISLVGLVIMNIYYAIRFKRFETAVLFLTSLFFSVSPLISLLGNLGYVKGGYNGILITITISTLVIVVLPISIKMLSTVREGIESNKTNIARKFRIGFIGMITVILSLLTIMLPYQKYYQFYNVEIARNGIELKEDNFFLMESYNGDFYLKEDVEIKNMQSITNFSGVLNGNGHTLTIDNKGDEHFSFIKHLFGKIENLHIVIKGSSRFIETNQGTIENVKVYMTESRLNTYFIYINKGNIKRSSIQINANKGFTLIKHNKGKIEQLRIEGAFSLDPSEGAMPLIDRNTGDIANSFFKINYIGKMPTLIKDNYGKLENNTIEITSRGLGQEAIISNHYGTLKSTHVKINIEIIGMKFVIGRLFSMFRNYKFSMYILIGNAGLEAVIVNLKAEGNVSIQGEYIYQEGGSARPFYQTDIEQGNINVKLYKGTFTEDIDDQVSFRII